MTLTPPSFLFVSSSCATIAISSVGWACAVNVKSTMNVKKVLIFGYLRIKIAFSCIKKIRETP